VAKTFFKNQKEVSDCKEEGTAMRLYHLFLKLGSWLSKRMLEDGVERLDNKIEYQ
jgi:hypothetical protein